MVNDHVPALDPFPGAKGRVTIALNNAETGELEYEHAQDNFVSPLWMDSVRRVWNWAKFTYSTTTGGTFGSFGNFPIFTLLLTDYAEEPSPTTERIWEGNVIGEGVFYQSASGNFRGNYNASESFQSPTSLRFVVDFATNQANATFQSIYMLPDRPTSGSFSAGTKVLDAIAYQLVSDAGGSSSTISSASMFWCSKTSDNVVFYGSGTGGGFGVTTYAQEMSRRYPYTALSYDTVPTPADNGVRGAWVEGSNVYTVWGQNTRATRLAVYRSPLNNIENYTQVFEFSNTWRDSLGGSGNFSNSFKCTYIEELDKYAVIGVPGMVNTLVILNKDFTEFERYGNLPSTTYLQFLDARHLVTARQSGIYRLDPVAGEVVQVTDNGVWPPTPNNWGGPVSFWGIGTGSGNREAIGVDSLIFSRALLPAPVQKTSQQTMKITYDFTFDDQFAWPPQ